MLCARLESVTHPPADAVQAAKATFYRKSGVAAPKDAAAENASPNLLVFRAETDRLTLNSKDDGNGTRGEKHSQALITLKQALVLANN